MGRLDKERVDEKLLHDSPDNIRSRKHLVRGTDIEWTNKDAQPFFVLNDGTIDLGIPRTTHIQTIDFWYKPRLNGEMSDSEKAAVCKSKMRDRRAYINHVLLQGRFWKNANYFSFWALPRELFPLAIKSICELADKTMPCKLFIRDIEYDIDLDNGIARKTNTKERDTSYRDGTMNSFAKQRIPRTWREEVEKASKNMLVSTFDNEKLNFRRPKAYEAYAIAAARIVDQCQMNDSTLIMDRFYDYIDELFGGQVTFNDLLDYYHFRLRKKMVGRGDVKTTQGIVSSKFTPHGKWLGKLEDFLNQNGIEDTQYQLMERGAKVITNDVKEADCVITNAERNGFVVDKVRRMNLSGNETISFYIYANGENNVNESRSMNKDTVQYNIFGEPIVVKAKVCDRGKKERMKAKAKEERENRKKKTAERDKEEFYERWKKVGVTQKDLFGGD